ncbi:MAG: PmoA family protein [Saprospiraceae bacterium]
MIHNLKTTLKRAFTVSITCLLLSHITLAQSVRFRQIDSLHKIEVYVDGRFFTAYLYGGGTLKKPVLFPLTTSAGDTVTRGYPLATRPGERVDHPHHYGLWFNHGDVNGIDFWNNSDAIPAARRDHYGAILHRNVAVMQDGDPGVLSVEKDWVMPSGDTILHERTVYSFSGSEHLRQIDHFTTLTATGQEVMFQDSKEGMFALRVARSLEQPSDEPVLLTDSTLQPAAKKRIDRADVTGLYLNSEGAEGDAVWGKRARWVKLSGILHGDSVAVVILDHPNNPNHPPHWMARGYGLFGVNPFGSKVYSEGRETLDFTLQPGESVSFRHRVMIFDGADPDKAYLEACFQAFYR